MRDSGRHYRKPARSLPVLGVLPALLVLALGAAVEASSPILRPGRGPALPPPPASADADDDETAWQDEVFAVHPLSLVDGFRRLTLLGDHLVRVEGYDEADFDSSVDDSDTFLVERFRFGFELELRDRLRWRVEGQHIAQQHAAGMPDPDEDGPDLRRAYLYIPGPGPLSFTFGRQDLCFGAERILGTYDFLMRDYAHDGARIEVHTEPVDVVGFYARPVETLPEKFNQTSRQAWLAGVHALWRVLPDATDAELLWVRHEVDRDEFGGDPDTGDPAPGPLALDLVSARVNARFLEDGFVDVEAAGQWGEFGPNDLAAWSVWAEAGWTFSQVWAAPSLTVAYHYGSGDGDPADRDTSTWVPLFPSVASYLSYGPSNVSAVVLGLGLEPVSGLKTEFDLHLVRLADERDALYDDAFAVYFHDPTGEAGDDAVTELSVWAGYQLHDYVTVEAAYAHFWSGDFIRSLTGDDTSSYYFYSSARLSY